MSTDSGETSPDARPAKVSADLRQRGSRSRNGFVYQDRCVALGILRSLQSGDLVAVDVELATDLVMWTRDRAPEYVSIKGRESNQTGDSGWTWGAIAKQRLLADLFRHWDAGGRAGTATVWTNAGLEGPATKLGELPDDPSEILSTVVQRVAGQLKIGQPDARSFLASLRWPRAPMPRAAEIDAVMDGALGALLEQHGRSAAGVPEARTGLLQLVADRSERDPRRNLHATEGAARDAAEDDLRSARRIEVDEIMSVVLTSADQASSTGRRTVRPARDPYFVGRVATVAALTEWARFGQPVLVRPLALVGQIGVGKTSIALQFAAVHPQVRVTVLDGANALVLAASVKDNLGLTSVVLDPAVPLALPGGPLDLVIVDGVVDASVVAPYLSAETSARVLVTTTAADLGRACQILPVDEWDDDDAVRFIQAAHPPFEAQEARTLAAGLGRNPLAISQAVAVCRHLALDARTYLTRLDQAPEVMLDLGVDPLRPRSLVAALRLSLETLSGRDIDARSVMELLCCLGSIPIARDFVGSSSTVVFLDGSDEVRVPPASDASLHLSNVLLAPGERDRVLYRLSTASLLRFVEDTIVVHPVVRKVVLALAVDLRPPLEVGLGHFDTYLGLSEDSGRKDEATDVARAAQLIELCSSRGHVGPAYYTACLEFAPSLARLGQVDQALLMAEVGHAWTDRRRHHLPPAEAVAEDLQHVHALAAAGRYQDAGERVPAIVSAAGRLGLSRPASEALRLLAQVATSTEDPESWAYLAENIPPMGDLDGYPRGTRLDLLMTHAHVAYREADLARTKEAVDRVLTEVGREASPQDGGWRVEALQFASLLARFESGGQDRSAAALARVRQLRMEVGRAPALNVNYTHALLDAVDALIDDDDIVQAESVMASAKLSMSDALLGVPHVVNASALIEGRLALHQYRRDPRDAAAGGHLERAQRLLLAATDGYRQQRNKRMLPAALINLSSVQHDLGRYADAAESAHEAVRIDVELFGHDHPETVNDFAWWLRLRAIAAQVQMLRPRSP